MSDNFAVIGGDLRNIELVKLLAKDQRKIFTYGLEENKELLNNLNNNIIICKDIEESCSNVDIIISSIPFSRDGETTYCEFSKNRIKIIDFFEKIKGKTLIVGSIKNNVINEALKRNIKIIDVMKNEELAILNTIATAEGTIQTMISNTKNIIHESNILILGFGRVAKTLAKKLQGLVKNVDCASNNKEELAWIEAFGYNVINLENLVENISKYDIIINTIPAIILNYEDMKYIKKDTLLIDLASNPGGIDKNGAKDKGLKLIHALGLPGKIAPVSSAKFIKKIIYEI